MSGREHGSNGSEPEQLADALSAALRLRQMGTTASAPSRSRPSGSVESQERAQRAAGAHAWTLCDRIDRKQQDLKKLRVELEGAIALCRALFDESCKQEDRDTLDRAERILAELAETTTVFDK